MNRLAKATLGLTGALALSLGGMSTAAATEHHPKLTKEVQPWVDVDESYVIPKGYGCKDEVKVKEKARYQDTLYKDNKGNIVKLETEFADWSTVKFTATTKKKHHGHHKKVTKSIKLNEGGDGKAHFYTKGDDQHIKVKLEGANWGQGKGIYGIPWSYGHVSYTIVNDTVTNLDLSHAKKVIQVCYKIGSKPVHGKNLPQPEEPAKVSRTSDR